MRNAYRLVVFVDDERKIIIIRPIGDMPGAEFVEKLFEAYEGVTAPWLYSRLCDFRRFDGHLQQHDLDEIVRRWQVLAAGQAYHANVAIISLDAFARIRLPSVSPQFPNETICLFTDYHEAMGWLLSADKANYLEQVRHIPPQVRPDDRIEIL